MKNKTLLSGKVLEIRESHSLQDNNFYEFLVEVPRKSGAFDTIPFVVSHKLLHNNPIEIGDYVSSIGEMRTINREIDGKSRLIVFNYLQEIEKISKEKIAKIGDKNVIDLQGFVVKKPVYRETGQGRRIADLLVAHNRSFGKESYIPTIAWGIDATLAKNLKVGECVSIHGRFQSRNYRSKTGDIKTVYELSVNSMSIVEE
ncbi:single-stranded DNA-binding protein [Lysinibacillus fusiformis]|uniref:single-stranded DNA-binding protein n=1 Tax=Lysinibacillus fusiformis TaxID=28031 RepID=UPI00046A6A3F|nr:single-stranded DNA-binding protein [Lysinibacillus fusiformis]